MNGIYNRVKNKNEKCGEFLCQIYIVFYSESVREISVCWRVIFLGVFTYKKTGYLPQKICVRIWADFSGI